MDTVGGDRRGELKRSEMGNRNDHILLYSQNKNYYTNMNFKQKEKKNEYSL